MDYSHDLRPHAVYKYTDQIYKVVQFYRERIPTIPDPTREPKHYDKKLDSSISRARRVVLELALCNHWDYFCTFTLSSSHDRFDLQVWFKSFAQWLRDLRKKGFNIKYLLIPERHQKGSWHAHGFLSGLPASQLVSFRQMDIDGYRSPDGKRLPKYLRDSEYLNWPAYQSKYGFCSLGSIRNPVACSYYITKYITKDIGTLVSDLGAHVYYASHGLQRSSKHIDFVGRDPALDRLLVNRYDFCATGMTHVDDGCDWTFCLEYGDFSEVLPLDLADVQCEEFEAFEQLSLYLKTKCPF